MNLHLIKRRDRKMFKKCRISLCGVANIFELEGFMLSLPWALTSGRRLFVIKVLTRFFWPLVLNRETKHLWRTLFHSQIREPRITVFIELLTKQVKYVSRSE